MKTHGTVQYLKSDHTLRLPMRSGKHWSSWSGFGTVRRVTHSRQKQSWGTNTKLGAPSPCSPIHSHLFARLAIFARNPLLLSHSLLTSDISIILKPLNCTQSPITRMVLLEAGVHVLRQEQENRAELVATSDTLINWWHWFTHGTYAN